MSAQYTIGLDYGTNSVRALIVNTANGREITTAVWNYAGQQVHAEKGIGGIEVFHHPALYKR